MRPEISKIMQLFSKLDISKLSIEVDDIKIKLEKECKNPQIINHVRDQNELFSMPINSSQINNTPISEDMAIEMKKNEPEEYLEEVISPIIGTFYRSPSPEKAPFVEIGQKVKKGETLCIIEAMKVMNQIESEVDGEIVDILLDDTSMVEYGSILFKIRPSK